MRPGICSHVIRKIMLDIYEFCIIIAPMYIETVPNRNSPPAILLREGWREGKRTRKRTLANLSHWPAYKIETLRRLLRNETLVAATDLFHTERTLPHGHVEAILGTIRKLGLDSVIAATPCRERNLVVAMIGERLIYPCSKLATTRRWHATTLAEELGVEDADEDDLYEAMDWLVARKASIERKLARRHLDDGAIVLYDVTSSYYEGRTCPLARQGHDRDGRKGLPIIVYGVLADREGRPIAVDVYAGNTGDPTTVVDQIRKLTEKFALSRVVLVGDRGMLTQPQIDKLNEHPGLGWITALTSVAIRKLVDQGGLQLSLLDTKNLAVITSPDYPGERLVVCFNPLLADERRCKRAELLAATEKELEKLARQVGRRTRKPMKPSEIGLKAGKILGRYKVGKHFIVKIGEGTFQWSLRHETIEREAALDGIYVIRTSESAERLSDEETVRAYKDLSRVERVFRCLKGIDLLVRPIRHRTETRVPAHIFLCMLAYYVEWHMRRALAPLLFEDEELDKERKRRDPILPAQPSASADRKKRTHRTTDGFPVHDFTSLMSELAARSRVTYKLASKDIDLRINQVPEPTPLQRRAYELLGLLPVSRK